MNTQDPGAGSDQDSASLIGLLVRQVLPDAPARASVALSADQFTALLNQCQLNRITPLLAIAVSDGCIEIGDGDVHELIDELSRVMTASVAIEALALRAVDVLESGGIDVRVTKGLATSHLDYPNPGLRQFGDADLLVRPDQFDDALALLSKAGMHQKYALRGSRWQIQHSLPLEGDGLELDLHHRLLHQAAGHLAARTDLFASPETFDLGGRAVRALPAAVRLIQAAGQNVLSGRFDTKYSSDVDVLRLMDATDEAYEIAHGIGLGWMLDFGIARAHRVAGLTSPNSGEHRGIVDGALRRIYVDRNPSAVKLAMAEAIVAPVRVTAMSAWSVVVPGDDYLALRGRSRRDQLWHQILRLVPRRSAHGFEQLLRRSKD